MSSQPVPLDTRGVPIAVGSLVCYATNDRHSGLQFGHVRGIKTKHERLKDWRDGSYYDDYDHRIVMNKTDVNGNVLYEKEWRDGEYVTTDQQQRSGQVIHDSNKFLVL